MGFIYFVLYTMSPVFRSVPHVRFDPTPYAPALALSRFPVETGLLGCLIGFWCCVVLCAPI